MYDVGRRVAVAEEGLPRGRRRRQRRGWRMGGAGRTRGRRSGAAAGRRAAAGARGDAGIGASCQARTANA